MKKFNLNEVNIETPYIIAEVSANHKQNKDFAMSLIDLAVESGADAVKFQTYTPDSITVNSDLEYFKIGQNNNWSGKSLYELYESGYTPYEWHQDLFDYAYQKKIMPFSSVFSEVDLDFLETLNCQIYKIASYEANDIELIKKIAKKNKPIFLSIGSCSELEVGLAISTLKKYLNENFVIFNCLSAYPAPINEMSFQRIPRLINEFGVKAGFSDHSSNSDSALVSYALGARFFEKHIMLNDKYQPLDFEFSLTGVEFKEYVNKLHNVSEGMANSKFEVQNSEIVNTIFKRSLFASKNIKKGDVFSEENIKSIRPSLGLHPSKYSEIIGKESKKNIKQYSPLSEDDY